MKRKNRRILLIVAICFMAALGTILLFEVASNLIWPQEPQEPRLACQSNEDCVPASCCHPTSAVSRAFGPNCTGIVCTLECKPDTIDCEQGYIACVAGRCKAVITSD